MGAAAAGRLVAAPKGCEEVTMKQCKERGRRIVPRPVINLRKQGEVEFILAHGSRWIVPVEVMESIAAKEARRGREELVP
jgi:hypothetical protein